MTIKQLASETKKLVAAGGLALGLVGFGLLAGINTAAVATNPDTGTYDEQTNLAQEGCWGAIPSPPVSTAWQIGDPESAGCAHAR
jgi:hypothetical protein